MKIPHNKITYDEQEVSAVQAVIRSGYWVGGTIQERVEAQLSQMFSTKGAVCVGSGLSALRLALLTLGVSRDDEVIIPAYSCVALANAVLSVGGVPVAVDVDAQDFNLCVDGTRDAITEKTKAIIAVNNFGVPANISDLKKMGVPVIEDCSHGLKVNQDNVPQGVEGDIAIFSFYATKLIAGGEGGAILSSDQHVIDFCNSQRDYTDQAPDGKRLNDKMTDIEAALVEVQLGKLPEMLSNRQELAMQYSEQLKGLKTPTLRDDRVWYRYAVQIEQEIAETIENLENKGVSARQPVENWLGDDIKNHPNAKKAYESILSLPLYPMLEKEEQDFVVKTITEEIKS